MQVLQQVHHPPEEDTVEDSHPAVDSGGGGGRNGRQMKNKYKKKVSEKWIRVNSYPFFAYNIGKELTKIGNVIKC